VGSSIIAAILQAFFSAFGRSLNDWLTARRAEQTSRDLGTAEANLGNANATIDAQQAELQAQADAPRSVDDALKRLEEGSA
jgi:hypothetical protein